MPKTDGQLNTQANVIKNETIVGANTPTRVGLMLNDIIDNKINTDKISTDVALGTSDALLPTQNAVKTYADRLLDANPALGTSNIKGATQNAIKVYVDTLAATLPKTYIAYLTQTASLPPSITIIKNSFTLPIVMSRVTQGNFLVTSGGTEFTLGKTVCSIINSVSKATKFTGATLLDSSNISFVTRDNTGTNTDGLLLGDIIKIEVYP
jgi:hypothetical protein